MANTTAHVQRATLLAALAAAAMLGRAAAQDLPGQPVPNEGARHAPDGTPLTYQHYPPASGTHYPRWARWGFYESEVPEGFWVHNLEHGGVVLLYRCDEECGARAAALRAVYDALPPSHWGHVKALATPYSRLDAPVAVVAWDRVERLDSVDAERILRFYEAFVDQGPEDVP